MTEVSSSSSSETFSGVIPKIIITDILGQSHPINLKSITRECVKYEDFKLQVLSLQFILPDFISQQYEIIIGKGKNKVILAENEKIKFAILFEGKLTEVFYNQICMLLSKISKEYLDDIYDILFKEINSHQTEIKKYSSEIDVLKYYIFYFIFKFQRTNDPLLIIDIYIKFLLKNDENKDNIIFRNRFDDIRANEKKFMLKVLYETMTEDGVSLLLNFTDEKFLDKDGKQISQKKYLKNLLEPFDIRYRNKKGVKDVQSFSTMNEAQLNQIFKVFKSIIKVVNGYSNSMYETPVPSCSYDYNCKTFNITNISNLFDMMAQVFLRSIGIILLSDNFIFLISSLSMSILNETDEKYSSIQPVFEKFMKDKTIFKKVCKYNILQFNTFYQWKLLKFFEKIDTKRYNEIVLKNEVPVYNLTDFNKIECCVFLYLLTDWWKSSSLKEFDLKEIANIFGLKDYIKFIIGYKPIKKYGVKKSDKKKYIIPKEPKNRNCTDWLDIIKKIENENEAQLIKFVFPCSSLEIISDITSLITCSITPKEMEEQLDNFKEFLTNKSFNLYNCKCCSNEFTSIDSKHWHTFPCSQCSIPPQICIECYNKTTILHTGHQLNAQTCGISCMQCNFVFPENINRFPEGTTCQNISEKSAEYFSCCFIGCNNFVHIPPVEGAICGIETGVLTDTFCETHILLLLIKDNAKNCPSCGIIITKTDGCNHMTCHCGTEFCFRKGCPYFVNGLNEDYNHPPYCRFGIKDVLTVAVFNSIIKLLEISLTTEISQNNISIITQCLYYISSNGFEDPLITSVYRLQQFLSSSYYYSNIPELIITIKRQLDVLFDHFTNQEMLDALVESVQENNSTLFDNYIEYLITSINSPVSDNISSRTSDGQLIQLPSSDEEDEVIEVPPQDPILWGGHPIDWDVPNDNLEVPNWGVPNDHQQPLDHSSSNEEGNGSVHSFDIDENDDEILERSIEAHRSLSY